MKIALFLFADGEAYQASEERVTFHKGITAHDTRPATQAHAEQPKLGRLNQCTTRIREIKQKRRSLFRVGTTSYKM